VQSLLTREQLGESPEPEKFTYITGWKMKSTVPPDFKEHPETRWNYQIPLKGNGTLQDGYVELRLRAVLLTTAGFPRAEPIGQQRFSPATRVFPFSQQDEENIRAGRAAAPGHVRAP